jgi:hypothetical protein
MEVDEIPAAKFEAEPGVRYDPMLRIPEHQVMKVVHRLDVLKELDRRAQDRYANIELFHRNHYMAQEAAHQAVAVDSAWHVPHAEKRKLATSTENEALKRQATLREARKAHDSDDDAEDAEARFAQCGPDMWPEAASEPPTVVRVELPCRDETPATLARCLMAQSGVANSEGQYNACLLALWPLQQLVEWVDKEEGGRAHLTQPHLLKQILAKMPE